MILALAKSKFVSFILKNLIDVLEPIGVVKGGKMENYLDKLFKIVRLSFICLTLFFAVLLTVNGSESFAASGTGSNDFSYSDTFDTMNRDFWLVFNHGGGTGPYSTDYSLATISDGILELAVNTTDRGPELISKPLKISANSVITASWRVKAHYGNEYFAGKVSAALVDYDTMYDPKGDSVIPYEYYDEAGDSAKAFYLMQVFYSNYSYNNYDPPVGGNSFGICGSVSGPVTERCIASPAVWDTFVTEKVEINIPEGVTKYWENETLIGQVKLNPEVDYSTLSYLRFWISPYGWYTGHEVDLDGFTVDVKDEASGDTCDQAVLDAARQKGYEAGRQACIDDPASCGLAPGNGSGSGEGCATFDLIANKLHIPCLDIGATSYWIDLTLSGADPVTLILNDFGENGSFEPVDPSPDVSDKSVTLSSLDNYSFSFVTEKITSRPNFDKDYDLSMEPWCVEKPAMCGNFVDLGAVDMSTVTEFPSSGYLSDTEGFDDCVELDPTHTFINKNRDGTHTVFRITKHEKPSSCEHVVDIVYRPLD